MHPHHVRLHAVFGFCKLLVPGALGLRGCNPPSLDQQRPADLTYLYNALISVAQIEPTTGECAGGALAHYASQGGGSGTLGKALKGVS